MCDQRDRLIEYVYDECAADDRRRIEAHLETCDTCQDDLRGFRATRQDLLAWDVPDRGSVWKPFAPARAVPSWRDVPRGTLAMAASVMFLIGAAGGFATRAFVPVTLASPGPSAQASVDRGVSVQQIRDLVRAELDQHLVPVSTQASAPGRSGMSDEELLRRVSLLIAQSEQRQGAQVESSIQGIRADFLTDLGQFQMPINARLQVLQDKVTRISMTSPPAGR